MPDPPVLAAEPLTAILAFVQRQLAAGETNITFQVTDPDCGSGAFAGARLADHADRVHRPLRVWVDLAERLRLRIATPQPTHDGLVTLALSPLDPARTWAGDGGQPRSERYGADSGYGQLHKHEDPNFVIDLADALERAQLPPAPRVLDLGVNRGDILALITALRPDLAKTIQFVGVDHSASALDQARQRFAGARFIEADLADLPTLELGRFDLVMSVGTLQSPGVDDRMLLRHIVRHALTERGAVILGVPNCSYLDGEMLYGAKMKNFTQPDLSLLIKTVAFYKRYLQQHRRRVFVTGKHYVFVTAVRMGAADA